MKLPAYCRLDGVLDRRTGADGKPYGIGFALALPGDWNGRFLFQGGGGLNGSVRVRSAPPPRARRPRSPRLCRCLDRHRAPRGRGFDASFMAGAAGGLDFAYQAVGRIAVLAKQIIAQHYAKAPDRSYFAGCSTGGREAMLMAQRHPTFFDGIISGAPAMRTNFSGHRRRVGGHDAQHRGAEDAQGSAASAAGAVRRRQEGGHRRRAQRLRCQRRPQGRHDLQHRPAASIRRRWSAGAKTDGCLTMEQAAAIEKGLPDPRIRRAVRSIPASCSTPASRPRKEFPGCCMAA